MQNLFFILSIFLFSSGCSGDIYEGELYTGQVLISKGTDISSLSFGELSAPSATALAEKIGVLENEEEKNQINAWEQEVLKEINSSPESERFGKKLHYLCDYLEFIDLDFVRLHTESKSLSVLLENRATAATAEYHARHYHKIMYALSYLFEITTKNRATVPIEQQRQTHEFLKANCPKYKRMMELIERSPLIKIEKQVETSTDVGILEDFLDRADKAVKPLDREEKTKLYADAVCQVLSRNPKKMLKSREEFETKEGKIIYSLIDLEYNIFNSRLRKIGLGKSLNDKRAFKKILAKSCPIYHSWLAYKQEQTYKGGMMAMAMLGLEEEEDDGVLDRSFAAPDVPYNSFAELDTAITQFRERVRKQPKGMSDDDYFKWYSQEICIFLNQLDINYVKDKNFQDWMSVAHMNYEYGVERPKDVKVLIYEQVFALYKEMAEDGGFKLPNRKKDWGHTMYYAHGYKKELINQCSELRKEILAIHKEKSISLDRELFGY